MLEVDPLSGVRRPPADAILPRHDGFTSLTLETYGADCSGVVGEVPSKRNSNGTSTCAGVMYANPAHCTDHYMECRNIPVRRVHVPNTEQAKVTRS